MGKFLAPLDEKVNFRKFCEILGKSKENCEKYIILAYFSKDLTNFAGIFRPFRIKKQIVGNFSKIFQIFSNNFLGKLLKTHYFSMFSKSFINHAFVFRAFGRKTQFIGKF